MNQMLITIHKILEVEKMLFDAQKNSNVDVLDLLLHDDLVAVAPQGQILTKQMVLESYITKRMFIQKATTEIEVVRLFGDTALSMVTMSSKGVFMGNPIEGKFKYLRTWKSFEDSLKLIGASIFQRG